MSDEVHDLCNEDRILGVKPNEHHLCQRLRLPRFIGLRPRKSGADAHQEIRVLTRSAVVKPKDVVEAIDLVGCGGRI